jgi:gas vesicle protein
MRIINFVAGFLVGAALAAIAVLLTTPQSGTELQAGIRNRIDGMVEESRKAYAARRAALEDQLTSLKAGGSGQPMP